MKKFILSIILVLFVFTGISFATVPQSLIDIDNHIAELNNWAVNMSCPNMDLVECLKYCDKELKNAYKQWNEEFEKSELKSKYFKIFNELEALKKKIENPKLRLKYSKDYWNKEREFENLFNNPGMSYGLSNFFENLNKE